MSSVVPERPFAPSIAPILLVVLGPTGAGKSDLALYLARELDGEIVNCDSVQVYQNLDIGSAKVPIEARSGIPHHLIDVIPPTGELTAGAYAALARRALAEIAGRGKLPIVAGGTGFYLRALLDGLSPAPIRNTQLRARLKRLAERRPGALHRFLRTRDKEAARRIHANDRQKLIRAIELSLSLQGLPRQPLTGFRILKIGLNPERRALYERINRRSLEMFHSGLIEETRALLAAGLQADSKALQVLGYKQAVRAINGNLSVSDAARECQTKTRQYAKRQMTWFRAEPNVEWLTGFGNDPHIQLAALMLAQSLHNFTLCA